MHPNIKVLESNQIPISNMKDSFIRISLECNDSTKTFSTSRHQLEMRAVNTSKKWESVPNIVENGEDHPILSPKNILTHYF